MEKKKKMWKLSCVMMSPLHNIKLNNTLPNKSPLVPIYGNTVERPIWFLYKHLPTFKGYEDWKIMLHEITKMQKLSKRIPPSTNFERMHPFVQGKAFFEEGAAFAYFWLKATVCWSCLGKMERIFYTICAMDETWNHHYILVFRVWIQFGNHPNGPQRVKAT